MAQLWLKLRFPTFLHCFPDIRSSSSQKLLVWFFFTVLWSDLGWNGKWWLIGSYVAWMPFISIFPYYSSWYVTSTIKMVKMLWSFENILSRRSSANIYSLLWHPGMKNLSGGLGFYLLFQFEISDSHKIWCKWNILDTSNLNKLYFQIWPEEFIMNQ